MIDPIFGKYFLWGALGSISNEMLILYEKYGKFPTSKFDQMVKNYTFWFLLLGMSAASGFIAWGINAHTTDLTPWTVILSGIGARSIVQQSAKSINSNNVMDLGDDDTNADSINTDDFNIVDYFK